jgi:hypothetical protein
MGNRARHALKRALPIFGAFAFVYAAYPYVTLFRLGYAIRHGDSAALERLVDWDGVREGLKEDVCDALAEEPDDPGTVRPVSTRDMTALPAFGSGFVRGIAGSMIDSTVTPRAIVHAAQTEEADPALIRSPQDQPRIVWAFFDSATTFHVMLRPPGKHAQSIRIQMELRHGDWKVTRAWLPHTLLMRANQRT